MEVLELNSMPLPLKIINKQLIHENLVRCAHNWNDGMLEK
jgi:hypothetical protein